MPNINKEYYPYPGYDHYYQVTKNPFSNIPKPVHTKTYTTDEVDAMIKYVLSILNAFDGLGKSLSEAKVIIIVVSSFEKP